MTVSRPTGHSPSLAEERLSASSELVIFLIPAKAGEKSVSSVVGSRSAFPLPGRDSSDVATKPSS